MVASWTRQGFTLPPRNQFIQQSESVNVYSDPLVAKPFQDRNCIDRSSRKIGFRDIVLCQEPLLNAAGKSFYFRVNGQKIFIGGKSDRLFKAALG